MQTNSAGNLEDSIPGPARLQAFARRLNCLTIRVGKLENQIEVLPLSPNDDRIRIATYVAIYSRPGLDRYAWRAVPPIHIIVKNGNVTLMGVVATEADKNLAGMMANGVSGVFKVVNDLRVERAAS
jgi:hyperosmotically inducible protein